MSNYETNPVGALQVGKHCSDKTGKKYNLDLTTIVFQVKLKTSFV